MGASLRGRPGSQGHGGAYGVTSPQIRSPPDDELEVIAARGDRNTSVGRLPIPLQVSEIVGLERLQKFDKRALILVAQAWFPALKLMGAEIVPSIYDQVRAFAEFK